MKTTHIVIITLLACATSGCVTHTTIKDEPRLNVRFGSAEAAQTFYDAYLSANSPRGRGSVVLSLPSPYWHRTVRTDNVYFNSAARAADGDQDGEISDSEAHFYASIQRPFAQTQGTK